MKERWSDMRRYKALFTCLASSADHFKAVASVKSDTFIIILIITLTAKGENGREIKNDNFTGIENELSKALSQMDNTKSRIFYKPMEHIG